MRTSVPGSELRRRSRGFTLLELMVVIAMIGLTTAVISLAIPDPAATRLDREAARLVAVLESARTQARAGALTVLWVPQPNGPDADYQFLGLPPAFMPPLQWQAREVRAEVIGARSIVLGPEPVIGPQSVVLSLEDRRLVIATDGLSPFDVVTDDASAQGGGANGGR